VTGKNGCRNGASSKLVLRDLRGNLLYPRTRDQCTCYETVQPGFVAFIQGGAQ
jgi:hypothetical protein